MELEHKPLWLLSSNLRRQYTEDVLRCLALPSGAMLHFRYQDIYVASQVDREVADGRIRGVRALLGYVAGVDDAAPFITPVRYATVASAERRGNMVIFHLRLSDYVDLDQFPHDLVGVHSRAREFIEGIKGAHSGKYYPVVYSAPDLRVKPTSTADVDNAWQQAVNRLALHETFAQAYFIRINAPVSQRGRTLTFNDDGRLEVIDQQSVRVAVTLDSKIYSPDTKTVLSCLTDGTFLRVSADSEYPVAHRYDSLEFWLHPAAHNFETLSTLAIHLESESAEPGLISTRASFPVVVRRSKPLLFARLVSTSLGALLVALPAILGPSSPMQLQIASAFIGAILLALGSIVLSTAK